MSLASANCREESWYELRPRERNSGVISFVSPQFDPVAALVSSELEVTGRNAWLGECSRLDTVGQFALHLPSCDPLRVERNPRKRKASAGLKDIPLEKAPRDLHPFEAATKVLDRGPFSRLHHFRWHRVRIVIRYVNAIRGILVGTLVAFDKHMNMILRDVEESYSMRPSDSTKVNEEIEAMRRQKLMGSLAMSEGEWFGRKRQMKNILVRGDNVVIISRVDQRQQTSESRYFKAHQTHVMGSKRTKS